MPVATALLRAPGFAGWRDGMLVFGTPLIGAFLQAQLMAGSRYGLAWSALIGAVYYFGLWALLVRRPEPEMRLLERSHLGLAIALLTVSVPLAFDAQVTSAFWAAEGTAVLWFGARQGRTLALATGLLMQLAAGIALLLGWHALGHARPVFNDAILGAFLVAAAGFVSARVLRVARRRGATARRLAIRLGPALVAGRRPGGSRAGLPLMPCKRPMACCSSPPRWWPWKGWSHSGTGPRLGARRCCCCPPCGWPPCWRSSAAATPSPGSWRWPCRRRWRRMAGCSPATSGPATLSLPPFVTWAPGGCCCWRCRPNWPGRPGDWRRGSISGPCWPGARYRPGRCSWRCSVGGAACGHSHPPPGGYLELGALPPLAGVAFWSVAANLHHAGGGSGLPYLPVLNFFDLAQLAAIHAFLRAGSAEARRRSYVVGIAGLLGFVWLTTLAARVAHHWGGVPFEIGHLIDSRLCQALVTLLWTGLAIVAMMVATRRASRHIWYGGFGLLAVVGVKLLLVDAAGRRYADLDRHLARRGAAGAGGRLLRPAAAAGASG